MITPGFYITRGGVLAEVTEVWDAPNSIWPINGVVNEYVITWTRFGGANSSYDILDEAFLPHLEDADDLIERITRETHPEYFL